MDGSSLKKWAEELQKKERILQEKEKELESKFKGQTINELTTSPSKSNKVGQLNHR